MAGRRPRGPPSAQRPDVSFADLVTATDLLRRQHALADPAIGSLVVHAESLGRVAQRHDRRHSGHKVQRTLVLIE
jgi:hypothetical protein